ncbi:hypothetical protein FRB95_006344 [Tulasnella sp. JGI-2019a]|nr:hypothetical protein FRB95_006344 [Tulasnella sp. JGI-2019a]
MSMLTSTYAPAAKSIKSVYRLVLRAASAAVLHHSTARDTLRKLYRPTFDEAFHNLKRHSDLSEKGAVEQRDIEQWMTSWNQQMDNTLSFLVRSATTRDTEHRVTRNLTQLVHFRSRRLRDAARARQKAWNPRLPAQIYDKVSSGLPLTKSDKAMAGQNLVTSVERTEMEAQRKAGTLDDVTRKKIELEGGIWNVVGQTVRMAEAQSGLALGHPRYDRSGDLL